MDVFVKGWRQKALDDIVRARRDRDALREQLTKMERWSRLPGMTLVAEIKGWHAKRDFVLSLPPDQGIRRTPARTGVKMTRQRGTGRDKAK